MKPPAPKNIRRLSWIKRTLALYLLFAIGMSVISAARFVLQDDGAYRVRYEGCHGEDDEKALGARADLQKKDNANHQQKQVAVDKGLAARQVPEPAIAVACQGNAIMRENMRDDAITWLAGFVPGLLGMVGAFVAVWELARAENEAAVPNGREVAERRSTNDRRGRGGIHLHFDISSILVVTTMLALTRFFSLRRRP